MANQKRTSISQSDSGLENREGTSSPVSSKMKSPKSPSKRKTRTSVPYDTSLNAEGSSSSPKTPRTRKSCLSERSNLNIEEDGTSSHSRRIRSSSRRESEGSVRSSSSARSSSSVRSRSSARSDKSRSRSSSTSSKSRSRSRSASSKTRRRRTRSLYEDDDASVKSPDTAGTAETASSTLSSNDGGLLGQHLSKSAAQPSEEEEDDGGFSVVSNKSGKSIASFRRKSVNPSHKYHTSAGAAEPASPKRRKEKRRGTMNAISTSTHTKEPAGKEPLVSNFGPPIRPHRSKTPTKERKEASPTKKSPKPKVKVVALKRHDNMTVSLHESNDDERERVNKARSKIQMMHLEQRKKERVVRLEVAKERIKDNTTKSKESSEADRLQLAYQWYTRCGLPDMENLKKRVRAMGSGCDITEHDVEMLPWDETKKRVNAKKMFLATA